MTTQRVSPAASAWQWPHRPKEKALNEVSSAVSIVLIVSIVSIGSTAISFQWQFETGGGMSEQIRRGRDTRGFSMGIFFFSV